MLLASVVRAMTGWAFSIIAVPLLSLVFAPLDAVVLNILLALVVTGRNLSAFRGQVSRAVFMPLLLSGLVGTPAGYLMHLALGETGLRILMGTLVVLLALAMLLATPRPRPLSTRALAWAGFASGVLGGSMGIAGPPVVLLFVLTATDMNRARATLGLGLFVVCLTATCAFALGGHVTLPHLMLAGLALPLVLAGDRLGNFLFGRYGGSASRRLSVCLTCLVGMGCMVQGLAALRT